MKRPSSRTYNVHEAKTNLSKLLEQTAEGYEVIIARAGVPVARLIPIPTSPAERALGTEKGRLHVPDDFDAPLSPGVLESFER